MIDSDGLLMIEPEHQRSLHPVDDEFSMLARAAWVEATPEPDPGKWWRGSHGCVCGESSDNKDYYVRGLKTNSLLVHYVEYHREDVPQAELRKLGLFQDIVRDELRRRIVYVLRHRICPFPIVRVPFPTGYRNLMPNIIGIQPLSRPVSLLYWLGKLPK